MIYLSGLLGWNNLKMKKKYFCQSIWRMNIRHFEYQIIESKYFWRTGND